MTASDQDPRTTTQSQLEMFGAPPAQHYDPDAESVRAELMQVLAKARAAPAEPWEAREVALYRVIFPRMANWLPPHEARQLRFEFEAEMKRLMAA